MPRRRIPGSARNGIVPRPAVDRLRAKLSVNASTGCHEWTGALDHKGYARVAIGGKRNRLAHRIAYEAVKGPIPAGLTLDHLCRNPCCCNPDHLEAVTSAENTRRKANPDFCPSGHPVNEKNTRVERDGRRRCRVCEGLARRRRADAQERCHQSQSSDGGES